MIKYLGSKRALAGVLGALAEGSGARTAVDLFTGTTRVAQEFKRRGLQVTAVDLASYSEVLARCYIATDATTVDPAELAGLLSAAAPHIGASTEQAEEAIAEETVRIARAYIDSGKPLNAVNQRQLHSGVRCVVRHYNRVGVLANVLHELRSAGINIEEMENTIFDGELAACCSLVLDKKPSEILLQRIGAAENVIQAVLK